MNDRLRWPGRWFRVTWNLPPEMEEPAIGLAYGAGAVGSSVRPHGRGRIALEAWYESEDAARDAVSFVASLEGVGASAEIVPIEDEGWLEASLQPREPIVAGSFVVWDGRGGKPSLDGGRSLVILPPSRAFGTGEHETTRLCLEVLSTFDVSGLRVLDLGAGSAVLAIAAARAGAAAVLALEIDARVVDVALENVRDNDVLGAVKVVCGSWQALAPGARFDLAIANIHKSALVRAARAVGSRLPPGGRAILSGFSPDDADEVAQAWQRASCREIARERAGEWAALGVLKHA